MADPVSDEMLHIASYSIQNTTMEKQISVDPISLKREVSANPEQMPAVTAPKPKSPKNQLPPLLPPTNSKFLSCSLPNSATSSPRFGASLLKKKWKNQRQASPQQFEDVTHLHSASYNPLPLQQEIQLRRSKSCGEGREYAPDDFDLWLIQSNAVETVTTNYNSSFSKTEVNRATHKIAKKIDPCDDSDEFKCGALCLYLPGFGGKAKPVRARKRESELRNRNVISRSVSLEKFECGSWASQAMVSGNLDDSMSHYFDLPLELIRGNVNDAHSPVTSGFLFDKDIKGVLKNGSARTSAARKSHESPRHVRFSTSSPTSYPASPASCITPRLRKAREDFNAFLEAQSA